MHSVDIIPADQVMPIGISFRVLFAHGFFQLFFVNIAHSEQFGILARHVRLLLLQMARELRRGSIEAEPFVKSEQDSACRFCDYASVCRFQEDRGDLPRHLRTLGRDEAFEKMEAEG